MWIGKQTGRSIAGPANFARAAIEPARRERRSLLHPTVTLPHRLLALGLTAAVALVALVLLRREPVDVGADPTRDTPRERASADLAGGDARDLPDEAPAGPAPSRTPVVEPQELRVDFEVHGRVDGRASPRGPLHVWLLEFADPVEAPSWPSPPPDLELLDRLDEHGFDLAKLEGQLVLLADVLAKTTLEAEDEFAFRLPRNVDAARTRLVAFDPERGECTPAVAVQRPVTVLTFPPATDLEVVVTHELAGASLTVEALDLDRRFRTAHTAPVVNGTARFRALPRRTYAFCVRGEDPPLYCATGPIDTMDHRFAIHLAVRTQEAPCDSDHHADEQGGTIAPMVEAGRHDSRRPGTNPLGLGARCPHCAFLSPGTYAFDRAKPKYAFGSFPMPMRVTKELDRVHVWDEDGVHSFEARAWLELR